MEQRETLDQMVPKVSRVFLDLKGQLESLVKRVPQERLVSLEQLVAQELVVREVTLENVDLLENKELKELLDHRVLLVLRVQLVLVVTGVSLESLVPKVCKVFP